MVSFDGVSASKVDDVTALPSPSPSPSRHKMADMCYYGNVMTTTRWWLCVTMGTLFYIFNSTVIEWNFFFFEVMFDFPGDIQSEKHSYTAFKPNRILTESCGIFRSIFSCSDINTGFVTNCWASALSPEIRYGKGYRMIAIQLVTPLFLPLSHL